MRCEICNLPLVHAKGETNAPILFLGEFPGIEETQRGIAFVGRMSDALTSEMFRIGIPMDKILFTNLWLHEPPKGKTGVITANSKCLDKFLTIAVEQMEKRKIVVLAGSEIGKMFLTDGIMANAGLVVKPRLCPQGPIYLAMPNPAIMFRQKHGEVRAALKKLKFIITENGV